SAACFAALLGTPDNGRWKIAPKGEVRACRRQYRDHTIVLETEFETDAGTVAVIDFMPIRGVAPDVVRIVEGRRGSGPVRSELVLRFDYGAVVPWVQKADGGIAAVAGPNAVRLQSAVRTHGENLRTVAEFTVSAGQRLPFAMTWYKSFDPLPDPVDA